MIGRGRSQSLGRKMKSGFPAMIVPDSIKKQGIV